MTIATIVKYLVGNRRAILDIAASPQSTWLGLLFVLSAGFAREYDGADLLHEPWHLVIPLGASLVSSFLLFCVVFGMARRRGCKEVTFRDLYVTLLRLYWMTAPLAWLYAIPVERFLGPAEATQFNLSLLALVSFWRVSLMTRVVSVLFNASAWAAFFVVMFFADSLALAALRLSPLPVYDIMGGIRHTPSEIAIQNTACLIGIVGTLSWPIWLSILSVLFSWRQPTWKLAAVDQSAQGPARRSLWGLATCSVIVWVVVLPLTQPEQNLKWRVERDLKAGRLHEAIALMSAHEGRDFPPHWDPPPRTGYGERRPSIEKVMKAITATETKPWVRDIFVEKFEQSTSIFSEYREGRISESEFDEDLDRYLVIVEELPDCAAIVKKHKEAFDEVLHRKTSSAAILNRIQDLYKAAGLESPETGESPPVEWRNEN